MTSDAEAPEVARVPRPTGPKAWRCLTCQYLVDSVLLPYRCPRCGASRVKMVPAAGGRGEEETEEE